MGFLDKIKQFKSRFTEKKVKEPEPLVLTEENEEEWANKLIEHFGLNNKFEEFQSDIETLKKNIVEDTQRLVEEETLKNVPERARVINAENAEEYVQSINTFVEHEFSELTNFYEEQKSFMGASNVFDEATQKNVSVLHEYLGELVKEIQSNIKELEDKVINFLNVLEEDKFELIGNIISKQEDLKNLDTRRGKFEQLLEQMKVEQGKIASKRHEIEERINKQRNLIRNEEALKALEKLRGLEEEMSDLTSSYENTCKNVKKYFDKYNELSLSAEATQIINELPKDAEQFIPENSDRVNKAFSDLADQLESEGRGLVGNLIDRLRSLSPLKDAARISEISPQQQELKKSIVKDVAALNIYDQQQFLIRARRQENEVNAKVEFIEKELDGGQKLIIKREIKSIVLGLGATVKGSNADRLVEEEVMEEKDALSDEELEEEIEETKKEEDEIEEELDEHDVPDVEENIPEETEEEPSEEKGDIPLEQVEETLAKHSITQEEEMNDILEPPEEKPEEKEELPEKTEDELASPEPEEETVEIAENVPLEEPIEEETVSEEVEEPQEEIVETPEEPETPVEEKTEETPTEEVKEEPKEEPTPETPAEEPQKETVEKTEESPESTDEKPEEEKVTQEEPAEEPEEKEEAKTSPEEKKDEV